MRLGVFSCSISAADSSFSIKTASNVQNATKPQNKSISSVHFADDRRRFLFNKGNRRPTSRSSSAIKCIEHSSSPSLNIEQPKQIERTH
jgi:hypothetical protein